jgi:hypothetical protein
MSTNLRELYLRSNEQNNKLTKGGRNGRKGSKEMINRFVASVEKLCEATAEVKDLSEKFEK